MIVGFAFAALASASSAAAAITWDELPYPKADAALTAISANKAVVDGKTYHTKYETLMRSGQTFGKSKKYVNTYGTIVDEQGKAILESQIDPEEGEDKPYVSNANDFTSFMPHGHTIYMVSHIEGPEPEATYFSKAKQNLKTGHIKVETTHAMDWSEYGGMWTPCAGSVSPWRSHMGSEEYEPDARAWADMVLKNLSSPTNWEQIAEDFSLYFNVEEPTNEKMAKVFYPYQYGYPWEVKTNKHGLESNVKHMAAGRSAVELPLVMPDQKTVYVTDDGDAVMLSVYVASTPADLSCGKLYAGKFTQTSAENFGTFDIEWIQLGPEACDHELKAEAKKKTFYDIFDAAEGDEATGTCPHGYKAIHAQPGGFECLRLKAGQEKWASRFETRRYAAYVGATTEWNKWEGITYDTKRNVLYTSMSTIEGAMLDADEDNDLGGPNDVRVAGNECGCVYTLELGDDYLATKMYALLCGDQDANTDEANTCNTEAIANPDNVAYVTGHDGLLIAEDSGNHENNVAWYYDLEAKTLARYFSSPVGAEVVSPYYYPNINGFAYILTGAQHPFAGQEDRLDEAAATGVESWIGYVGPFKARHGSCNMAENNGKCGRKLWNDFPAIGGASSHGKKKGHSHHKHSK